MAKKLGRSKGTRPILIDLSPRSSDNSWMSTETIKSLTQEEADHRHVIEHAFKGKPLDVEVAKRVHDRADKVREDMKARGVTVDAVELMRQSREEV